MATKPGKSGSNNTNKVTTANGKSYTVGQTVTGKNSGKSYTVQADGTFTSGGKTYNMGSDGKLREQKSASTSNSKTSSTNTSNNGGTTGSTNTGGSTSNYSNDIKTLQNLGATNASDAYKKAIDAGYSKEDANKLANTYGRLNAAAGASASTLYQYGVTQSDVNQFNIMQGTNIAKNSISTGTYTFNTNTYKDVQNELHTSAQASQRITTNIDNAMANTDKNSEEYKQLADMRERMFEVNQSTSFISNRLADAYNATKAADDAVQRIVMSISTDNLKITVGKQVGYDLSNSVNTRENDAAKWSKYLSMGIIGNGGKNNSTVTSLNEVNNLPGNNVNTVGDILTAYDIKRNLDSCTSYKDYAMYARNNEDGLKQVAEQYSKAGYGENQWKTFLDTYYVTDANGNKRERTVTQEAYDSYVDYFNSLNSLNTEQSTVDVPGYEASSNDTTQTLSTTTTPVDGGVGISYVDSNGKTQTYTIDYDDLKFIPFSTTYPELKDATKQKAMFAVGENLPSDVKQYFSSNGYQLDGFGLMGIMIGESKGGASSFYFGTDGGSDAQSHITASASSKDIVAKSLVDSGICSDISSAMDKVNNDTFYGQLAEAVTASQNATHDGNDIKDGCWGAITDGMKRDTNRWRENYINGTYDKSTGGTGENGERYVYYGG